MTNNRITNWQKLKLLLWKNWILQWSQKIQLFVAIVLPVLYLVLLVVLRSLIVPESMSEKRYESVSLADLKLYKNAILLGNRLFHSNGSLNVPKLKLAYSPTNKFNHAIVAGASKLLKLNKPDNFSSANVLEDELMEHNYIAGIEFDTSTKDQTQFSKILKYSLRFPSELRTMQGTVIDTWRTSNFFPKYDLTGPRNQNASDGGMPVGYLREGFLPIQNALFLSYIYNVGQFSEKLPTIEMQRFPYPKYIFDPLLSGLQQLMPLIMLLSYIYPCSYIAKYVTQEKEKQLKEIMKIMGLHSWLHWAAWFIKSFLMLTTISVLIVGIMKAKFTNNVAILTFSNGLAVCTFLLIYSTASICFCFMLAVFFSKASTAAAVTAILWFITYVPYSFAFYYYDRLTKTEKLLGCLLSNTALGFGIKVIMAFEGSGEGMNWSNMIEPVSEDDSLALINVIGMLFLAALIYMLVCLYVEQIYPGEYGMPKPWHFPFHWKFWRCLFDWKKMNKSKIQFNFVDSRIMLEKWKQKGDRLSLGTDDDSDDSSYMEMPHSPEIGVRLARLSKVYGNRLAVKNLSLDMYVNEITVLLGHNGAGKTTTILMLTGILPPTEGTAFINKCDIRKDLDCARQSLGICPQHNVLFEQMSVKNHIIFFSSLKGVSGYSNLKKEITKYIKIMELEDKENVAAAKLSGGMKRKLSLCCALCGNTKTVLCDEPSSGVDPAARRRLWDLLQAEKIGRTILLTTHHMDEADVLGDRIAIMCDGKLQCYGTPFTLKKHYGSGYRLICVKRQGCIESEVTALLREYIPDIGPESEIGTELSYRLPSKSTNMYANILGALEDSSEKLNLAGFGLSISTLEEVFMRVGAEHAIDNQQRSYISILHGTEQRNTSAIIFDAKTHETNKCRLNINKWCAMFLKKLLITFRNWKMFLLQLLLPIVFVVITIYNSRGGRIYYNLEPLPIELSMYSKSYTVLEVDKSVQPNSIGAKIAKQYETYINSFGSAHQLLKTNELTFENYIIQATKQRSSKVNKFYMAGATIAANKLIVWLNNKPLHTAPLTLNILHNAIARALIGPDAEVRVVNAPLPYHNDTLLLRLNKGSRIGAEIAVNLCMCMSFITAFYSLPLIKERERRSKLLQFVSGVNTCIYWLSQFILDYFTFTLMALLAIISIACFQERGLSTVTDLSRYFVILLVFGLAALPLTYVFAFCFTDGATGFLRISIFNLFTGVGFFTISLALAFEMFQTKYIADKLRWFFRIFPHFSLASGLHRLHLNFIIRQGCHISYLQKIPEKIRCAHVPICCAIPHYYDWITPGIMPELVYLTVTAFVLTIILLLSDSRIKKWSYHLWIKLKESYRRCKGGADQVEDDVLLEADHVTQLTKEERAKLPLVLDRVSKRYGRHVAVNEISLCVSRGECFGLLGVNGAGKTSTFKMLTGDVGISSGNAYVTGISLRTQMHKVYSKFGYCPQFDALFDELTGRETMRIYCLLRGVRTRYIRTLSEQLAQSFGFVKHIDKRTKHYSGGNKRKLSAAISLIGNPIVMYLDEPTSGMDPAARRQLWNMVCNIRDVGKSIVLTSHSMEECEALCTRLAIMVNGEFKCMGSTQHLKNKYSKGLVLKIKLLKASGKMEVEAIIADLLENVDKYISEITDLDKSEDANEETTSQDARIDSTAEKPEIPEETKVKESSKIEEDPDKTDKLEVSEEATKSDDQNLKDSNQANLTNKKKFKKFVCFSKSKKTKEAPKSSSNIKLLNSTETVSDFRLADTVETAHHSKIKEFISTNIPDAIFQEEYEGLLTFYIPLYSIKWSKIFDLIESNREELHIEDYTISQTTLEEIFLQFAREIQKEDSSILIKRRKCWRRCPCLGS